MADSEVRQKWDLFLKSLSAWKIFRLTALDGFAAGMRAGEIARWIPAETPPTVNDEYLVCAEDGVQSADWREGEWFTVRTYGCDSEERQLFNVTHWQPLPAAPEEKK